MFDTYVRSPGFTDMVNRVLMAAQLAPVVSIHDSVSDSDAGIAAYRLFSMFRSEASRGWWFNTQYRRTYTESGNLITVNNGLHAVASKPLPGCPTPPSVRLEVPVGSSTPVLFNEDTNTTTWDDDTEIELDVIFLPSQSSLPLEFSEYCVLKASRLFAIQVGIKVDPLDEQMAYDALDKKDAELGPTYNRFRNPQLQAQISRHGSSPGLVIT